MRVTYKCPRCGAGVDSEYDEYADIRVYFCVECDWQGDVEEMEDYIDDDLDGDEDEY